MSKNNLSNSKVQTPSRKSESRKNNDDSSLQKNLTDNFDSYSSISFNTGVLREFDNMDSISQVMGASEQDSNSGAMDLKNVGAEISKRDKKIQDLLADRNKLKSLLKKAKGVLDSITGKYKTSQD